MKSLLELYSSYKLDYDYYDYKNGLTFSLFVENFETKVQIIEEKVANVLNKGGKSKEEDSSEDEDRGKLKFQLF